MQFSIKQLLIGAATVAFVLSAYLRGNDLFNANSGLVYAFVAVGLLFLGMRAIDSRNKLKNGYRIIVLVFAIILIPIFAFPAIFNGSLSGQIQLRQAERRNNAMLQTIISSDPRFGDLRFESDHMKWWLIYRVYGTLDTHVALADLRTRIFNECPDISPRWLYWELTVNLTATKFSGNDQSIFGALNGNVE